MVAAKLFCSPLATALTPMRSDSSWGCTVASASAAAASTLAHTPSATRASWLCIGMT